MLRKTPLKRKARLRPRSKKRKAVPWDFSGWVESPPVQLAAADTLESARRREWLRAQPCVFGAVTADPCSPDAGDECHVNEGKGVGIKSHRPTFKMCRRHHEMYDGQAKHRTVIPLGQLQWRAFGRLASELTERDWQEVQAHEERRRGLR